MVPADEPERGSASDGTAGGVGRGDTQGEAGGGDPGNPLQSGSSTQPPADAQATAGAASSAREGRALQCCAPPAPQGPAPLAEAMEAACQCSMKGDLEGLKAALQHARTFDGFAMNVQGTQSRTPLYKACHGRQPEVVKWLLEQEDYVPDADGNRDAYKGICATEQGHVKSKDPGERTAAIMRDHGYSGSGHTPTTSPTTSPTPVAEPELEPDSEPEPEPAPVKGGDGWRQRFACCGGGSTEYNRLLNESVVEEEEPASPKQCGLLSAESKKLIGQNKSFRKDDKKVKGENTLSSNEKIIAYLDELDDDNKYQLQNAAGPETVTVDGREFELTVKMCQFDDPPAGSTASEESADMSGIAVDPDAEEARDDTVNDEMMLIYVVTEEQKPYKLEVGRKHDALCFYSVNRGNYTHGYLYKHCAANDDGKVAISCEGSCVTLTLAAGEEIDYNAASVNDAEAICYFVQLGYNSWNFSPYSTHEKSDGRLHQLGSAALQALDVDITLVSRCQKACSPKKCSKACKWLATVCKGCWEGLCAFFDDDVTPDHSTPTCVWLWIFGLQLASHLLFPPLVLWSRTRKADEMPEELVRQRFVVLSVRWIVIVGTLALYADGRLPSMASSEPVINVLMWLFVVMTHSMHEASLDEVPQQFDDTLTAAFNHSSRHVNSTDQGADNNGRLIEHELAHFLRHGRNKQSKFSHRMTERRLHELHGDHLQIDNARFESFHSTELQSDLSSGGYILSLGSAESDQTRIFDEVITTLQTIFHETPDWCLKTSLGDEYGEGVVPDSVRKAAAMVRMHVKDIQRKRYSMTSGGTAAYAFEVDRLADEAVKWESEGTAGSTSNHTDEEKDRRCVLSRDHAHSSNTDEQLREWDELARRVADGLSHNGQGEKWAQRCYALALTLFSSALVVLWIWLGAWLEVYVSHYLTLDCAEFSCACWSMLAVGAACGLVWLVSWTLQSVFRRFETFRTTTLSNKLVEDVKQFVTAWKVWEEERTKRTKKNLPQEEQKQTAAAPAVTDAAEEDDDDEAFGGMGLFGDEDEEELELEPEPEPEQTRDKAMGTDAMAELSLEELTALSADKLFVGGFDGGASRTDMWCDLSTRDFDRFALELSRVKSRLHRNHMLTRWKDLRVNEMMAPHRETTTQSLFSCCSRKSHDEVKQEDDEDAALDHTRSTQRKESTLENLWEDMVEGRVERERQIIELRAELISRLEQGLKTSHGVSTDEEAPTSPHTTPVKSRLPRQRSEGSQSTFGEGAYEKEKLQAYLVAESILALAHTQSKKLYATHLLCIGIVCVLDALCHPLKDIVSGWLDVPCDEDVSHRCVLNGTHDSSWSSPSIDLIDLCGDVSYNETLALPCGEVCDVESTVFFSCTPKVYEVLVRTISSIVGASLVFSIFCDLAEVIRGYQLRFVAIQYFSQLTPNQGSLTHLRKNHFGLLPTFEFTTKRNIIVWNRIRVFLQTYDQHNFSVSQHKITWILMIPVVFVIGKLVKYISGDPVDTFLAAEDFGEWSKYLLRVDPTPEMVDTLIIKAILLQFMGGALICHMLYIGVCTTRLHEHDIPHILLLKKAEITAGQVVPMIQYTEPLPSLFYSNAKRIKLWCKWTQLDNNDIETDSEGTLSHTESARKEPEKELSAFVKQKIEDIRKHVEDIMGIPTDDFGGLGISVRDHRKGHEEDGGHVPAQKTPAKPTPTRERVGSRDSCLTDSDEPGSILLSLEVTIRDGHDIFVDVSELNDKQLNHEQRELMNSPGTGRTDAVIIASVNDITEPESTGAVSLERASSHEELEVSPTSEYQAMMQLTQLLDSLIRVMAEERREVIHAPTIEDTRPALNLPSCCMNYRIGLTTTLFGTIMTVMATSLFSLLKSLM